MLCRHPFIRDPTGKVLLRGPVGDFEDRIMGVPFPCGQCLPCRINKRRVWTLRLCLELFSHAQASFVTLTYDDDDLPLSPDTGLPVLCKRDCQLWLKRLRKQFNGTNLRYYLAGEYGTKTHRPHYHAILFGISPEQLDPLFLQYDGQSDNRRKSPLWESWRLGLVHVGECNRQSIQYVAGYVTKKFTKKGDAFREFSLQSRRPGIGANSVGCIREALIRYTREVPRELRFDGKKWPLGRYLVGKLEVAGLAKEQSSRAYLRTMVDNLLEANSRNEDFLEFLTGQDDGRFELMSAKDKIFNSRSAL